MAWNWQQPDWPTFSWDAETLHAAERRYIEQRGTIAGSMRHLAAGEATDILVQLLSDEAVATSEIEGDILDRVSVRSSLRNALGISGERLHTGTREKAIADLALDNYRQAAEPLRPATLFTWHETLMHGRRNIAVVGGYRQFAEPMQIVSGNGVRPKIYFEAPPSDRVPFEMERFFEWFTASQPGGPQPLPAITRAGIAHLYFESIHPFEDGNGRIGRALSEKVFAQDALGAQMLLLSSVVLRYRREYYDALAAANTTNDVTGWLLWFAGISLTAQHHTQRIIEWTIAKAKFFDLFRTAMNERQSKAIGRMFEAGIDGFTGGMSAGKYVANTGCSTATATRDLSELTAMGALRAESDRRHRRYHLNIDTQPDARIRISSAGDIELT